MKIDTHITAPTRFVEATGIRYAYRRFGRKAGRDHWGSCRHRRLAACCFQSSQTQSIMVIYVSWVCLHTTY